MLTATRMKGGFGGRLSPRRVSALFCTALVLMMASVCCAGMQVMTDGELSGVVGQGFSSFTMADGVARADFGGISASTFTEIDSLKMGYWDKGNGGGVGWDQNWSQVKLGTPSSDLTFNGFFFQAVFDQSSINDPANRKLLSVTMGSKDVTGQVTANFQSLSATVGGVDLVRANQGLQTYQFNHTELSLDIEVAGPHKGLWINMGNATKI